MIKYSEEESENMDINWNFARQILKYEVYQYLRRMEDEFATGGEFITFMHNYLTIKVNKIVKSE